MTTIATGRCQICSDKIHLTKNYKWLHDSREPKEHFAVLAPHTLQAVKPEVKE